MLIAEYHCTQLHRGVTVDPSKDIWIACGLWQRPVQLALGEGLPALAACHPLAPALSSGSCQSVEAESRLPS